MVLGPGSCSRDRVCVVLGAGLYGPGPVVRGPGAGIVWAGIRFGIVLGRCAVVMGPGLCSPGAGCVWSGGRFCAILGR